MDLENERRALDSANEHIATGQLLIVQHEEYMRALAPDNQDLAEARDMLHTLIESQQVLISIRDMTIVNIERLHGK